MIVKNPCPYCRKERRSHLLDAYYCDCCEKLTGPECEHVKKVMDVLRARAEKVRGAG